MSYKVITEHKNIDINNWSNFVENHPNGNVFQTQEMYEVYKYPKHWNPVVLVVEEDGGKIVGSLLAVIQSERSGIVGKFSARSIVWGGPLIENNNLDVLDLILKEYNRLLKNEAIYSQFRNLWEVSEFNKIFHKFGYEHKEHLNILIDLKKTEDGLWKEVHSKRRNEIRRAIKEGVVVKELHSEKDVELSYQILREIYQRAKLPFAEFTFFLNAYKILKKNNLIKFFGAYYENELIGTMYILCYKNRMYDWYAGSYNKFYNKYPNDLLPWEVFKNGKLNNFEIFDFGGAGKPGVPYGVRDYKKKFGGEFVNFGRYEKIHNEVLYKIGKAGLKLYKRLI